MLNKFEEWKAVQVAVGRLDGNNLGTFQPSDTVHAAFPDLDEYGMLRLVTLHPAASPHFYELPLHVRLYAIMMWLRDIDKKSIDCDAFIGAATRANIFREIRHNVVACINAIHAEPEGSIRAEELLHSLLHRPYGLGSMYTSVESDWRHVYRMDVIYTKILPCIQGRLEDVATVINARQIPSVLSRLLLESAFGLDIA